MVSPLVYVLHLMSPEVLDAYADENFFGANKEDHVIASESNEDEDKLTEDEQKT